MSLEDIVQVSISLNTSGASRAGFGTPQFTTAHNYFTDRVRTYTDSTSVGVDMTTESNGFAAAVSVFDNTPSVDQFKIGRLIASSIVGPEATGEGGVVETGIIYTITVTDEVGTFVNASYTTLGGDALADIVTALVSQINGGGLNVTLVNNGDTFTIQRAAAFPTNDFVVSNIANNTITAAKDGNTAGIIETLVAIQEVDDDWYVLGWEDHTTVEDILDVANFIESLQKLYFVGSAAASSIDDSFTLGNTPSSADDVLAFLADGNFFRTIGWWHQDADTTFNELTFAGYNLPFDAGSVVWGNLQISTSNAKNTDGNKLTTTQQQNLADRFSNWAAIQGNIIYTREGKVVGDEWIDIIRGRDNLQSDLKADLFDILTNQQGTKIPYTDKGINIVAGVVDTRLNDYKVNRDFLTDPITINVPKAADISRADKVDRILRDLTFVATLANAIQLVDLQGILEL